MSNLYDDAPITVPETEPKGAKETVKEEKPKKRGRRPKTVKTSPEPEVKPEVPEKDVPVEDVVPEEVKTEEEDGIIRNEYDPSKGVSLLADKLEEARTEYVPNDFETYPEDYNYLGKVDDDSVVITEKDLFLDRKIRSTDVNAFFCAGSMRSQMTALNEHPNPFYFDIEAESDNQLTNWWRTCHWMATNAYNYSYDGYRHLLNSPHAKWRNGIVLPSGKSRGIRSQVLSFETSKLNQRKATEVLNAALNMGKNVDLFLPHSGFSVTLRPPTLSEFIECERKISDDKLKIYRNTRGLILSSDISYVHQAIFDLFLTCLVKTSIDVTDPNELRKLIMLPDINDIAWSLVCSKYPNGFVFHLPCFANPNKCNYVTSEVFDIRKMYVVDNSKITDAQRVIAGRMRGTQDIQSINDYIDGFDYGDERFVELRSELEGVKIRVVLGMPSLDLAFSAADAWRNHLESIANTAFKQPLVDNHRSKFLTEQRAATKCLTYEPFVSKIEIYNEDEEMVTIDDTDAIRNTLAGLSSDPLLASDFILGVEKFINKITVSMTGIPNMKCPGCGSVLDSHDGHESCQHIIPFDVVTFFTTLCQQLILAYQDNLEARGI